MLKKKFEMKKLVCYALCFFLLLTFFAGCGSKASRNKEKLSVVCTVFPQYDFVRQIAGDKVKLTMLVPLGVESHDYRLENMTVADLKTVKECDIFIYLGGESDSHWIKELKASVGKSDIEWIAMTDTVGSLEIIKHNHDGHEDGYHTTFDEHIWTSPKKAVESAGYICEKLCLKDAVNREAYKNNYNDFANELMSLDRDLTDAVTKATTDTLIFADRFPFRYLCSDYDLKFFAAFDGCSTAVDPSVAQIAEVIEAAEEADTKTVFYMENSDSVYAEQIAQKVGARSLMLHSCHTVTRHELQGGVTYLKLMKENIEKIMEALK